jgi:hypothetical protein
MRDQVTLDPGRLAQVLWDLPMHDPGGRGSALGWLRITWVKANTEARSPGGSKTRGWVTTLRNPPSMPAGCFSKETAFCRIYAIMFV